MKSLVILPFEETGLVRKMYVHMYALIHRHFKTQHLCMYSIKISRINIQQILGLSISRGAGGSMKTRKAPKEN